MNGLKNTQGWWKWTEMYVSGNSGRVHMLEPRKQNSHILWHTDTSSCEKGYLYPYSKMWWHFATGCELMGIFGDGNHDVLLLLEQSLPLG